MIKFIGKYLSIGLLIGVGIAASEYIAFQITKSERAEMIGAMESSVNDMVEMFYKLSDESIFNSRDRYDPADGLTFSLQEYELKEETVTLAGVVSNVGVKEWDALIFEFEVFNSEGKIVSECAYGLRDLEPGGWESAIVECPLLKAHMGKPINQISFKLKKSFAGKTHGPS